MICVCSRRGQGQLFPSLSFLQGPSLAETHTQQRALGPETGSAIGKREAPPSTRVVAPAETCGGPRPSQGDGKNPNKTARCALFAKLVTLLKGRAPVFSSDGSVSSRTPTVVSTGP
jgi:hypothetical protein